ncbi:hypothetical protein [Psychromicrobium sp. YIM B11713]|uniref:hypothetical protein n=1 Tax=Psychromicrobium sp. YIM B11713 TaxID=3145233 RepID=UPI00374FD97B
MWWLSVADEQVFVGRVVRVEEDRAIGRWKVRPADAPADAEVHPVAIDDDVGGCLLVDVSCRLTFELDVVPRLAVEAHRPGHGDKVRIRGCTV